MLFNIREEPFDASVISRPFELTLRNAEYQVRKPAGIQRVSVNSTLNAFQVVLDRPFAAVGCFMWTDPAVVSARTFLSQLL